ncbi:hypothetical protein ACFQ1S_34610 [Kibdelosporangium lantanae]|uniref:Uncharacterized protein n=1 Tax=Kibdelosporangium lantanae TaxID=1497396 RepID=A0ABW3MIA2_9PSEU
MRVVIVGAGIGGLVTALRGDTPKIVHVTGTINGNVDDRNRPVTCDQYADPGYSLDAYLKQYDPTTWGTAPVTGPIDHGLTAGGEAVGHGVEKAWHSIF